METGAKKVNLGIAIDPDKQKKNAALLLSVLSADKMMPGKFKPNFKKKEEATETLVDAPPAEPSVEEVAVASAAAEELEKEEAGQLEHAHRVRPKRKRKKKTVQQFNAGGADAEAGDD